MDHKIGEKSLKTESISETFLLFGPAARLIRQKKFLLPNLSHSSQFEFYRRENGATRVTTRLWKLIQKVLIREMKTHWRFCLATSQRFVTVPNDVEAFFLRQPARLHFFSRTFQIISIILLDYHLELEHSAKHYLTWRRDPTRGEKSATSSRWRDF